MKKTIKLSLISVALLSSLHAENQYTLDTISVTASQGTTLDKKDVTDSVTIITKEAIEESRVTTLNEALNKLGGISMTQNGGIGHSSSMLLRGMDTSRLLVLIDGIRYNNPTLGSAAEFSQIMLYNVEQIEIIKGAQSGVWGSDASGGVINIITSKAKKGLHGVANIEYGSYDTKKTSIQASYATDKYDFLISGLILDTDGFSTAEPKQSEVNYGKRYDELGLEKDLYKNQSFNARLGINITENDKISASMQTIDSTINYDDGGGESKDSPLPNSDLKNSFYNIAYNNKGSINDLKLNYSLSTFERTFTDNYGDSSFKGSVNEVKLDDKISYMENSFFRVGASYQKFEQENITANTDKSYSAISAFATNYNKLELFSGLTTILTESIRYDKYDEFDDSLTGKIGAKQFLFKDFYISTNIGTGYNAPTLGQLYGSFGPNPDLKPEKSKTFDITLGNDTIWVTGFYNEIEDLIEYVITDYVTYAGSYQQRDGTSKFQGVEIGYEDYYFDALGVNAMYTYVETENADGEALRSRPKNQIDVNAIYYVSNDFDIGINAQYIGTRYDRDGDEGAQTGEYVVAGFVTNIKANEYVTFYGKIDNITDEYYQTRDGYATAGRSLYLGLTAKY